MSLPDYFNYCGPFSLPNNQPQCSSFGPTEATRDHESYHSNPPEQNYLASPYILQDYDLSQGSPALISMPLNDIKVNNSGYTSEYNASDLSPGFHLPNHPQNDTTAEENAREVDMFAAEAYHGGSLGTPGTKTQVLPSPSSTGSISSAVDSYFEIIDQSDTAGIQSPTLQCAKQEPTASGSTRKRGRPRKCQSPSPTHAISSTKNPNRIPHCAVERKYREGLNAAFQRLRNAVPTIPQGEEGVIGVVRPSKAVIIAAAIDYIRRVQAERDAAQAELDIFKSGRHPNDKPGGQTRARHKTGRVKAA